jgi:PAS domain S-box-containing protein
MNFTFNQEQLNKFFPYYLIFDENLIIASCSISITELTGVVANNILNDVFIVENVNFVYKNININLVSQLINQPLALQLISKPGILINGQFEQLNGSNQIFFYGDTQINGKNFSSDKNEISKNQLSASTFYKDVLNTIPANITVLDTHRKYVFLNSSTGYDEKTREGLIGKTNEDFSALKKLHVNSSNGDHHFEDVLITKENKLWEEEILKGDKVKYNLHSLNPIFDNNKNVKYVMDYSIDITGSKYVERQLSVNEKKYNELYFNSPVLIYTYDLNGKVLSCNPATQALLGYSEAELTGVNIVNFLPAFVRTNNKRDYLDKIIKNGYNKGVFRVVPKDENKIIYLYYQHYKVQESDSESYIIGFSVDITDRIKKEKDLRYAKFVTESVAKQKEIFLANMSHEIRTPINGILGLNNLLLKTKLDEQQENYVKLTSESINNLLILINDILDIGKIGFGKVEFESNPFSISHKILRTIQLFQHKAKEKGLELLVDNNISNDIVVKGDQYRFAQILSNLISNAIKFTNTGYIAVSANTIESIDNKVTIEFSIKDTGIGIDKNSLSEIFKPFVQASLSTTRKYGGTGLGLSICKKLIELQGGDITVHSIPDKGTEFKFTLTYDKNSNYPIVEEQPLAIDSTKLHKKKILVGEDVELNQFLIKHLLESWGCEVDIVDTGIKIIEKLESNDYDIILMDIQMPEMDGLTAARYIRDMTNLNKAGIPILAFTASAMKGDIQNYKNVKMNDFILKPYSEKLLYEKLISVLNLNSLSEIEKNVKSIESEETLPADLALYDLSSIRSLSKDDDILFNKVLNILITMLSAEIGNIRAAAKGNNWKEVSNIVHKIKTSLIHIKVDSLKQTIMDLEHYEAHSNEKLNKLVEQFCGTLDNILVYLKIDLVNLMNTL